jgi:SAM-dependent methyltransferase
VLYDTIGAEYAARRVPDKRIAAAVTRGLGDASSVVNVGAGLGSYEPADRYVVAVEPSMTMIHQRPLGSAPVVQARAERLPFKDNCSAAAMAVLTIHHWSDRAKGLQELGRIARNRIAILTWDPDAPPFWLTEEYFPAIAETDRHRFPSVEEITRVVGRAAISTVAIPRDCVDGFLGAYWCRPRAYLDPAVRSGMSAFADLPGICEGLRRLEQDLDSGVWDKRFGYLLRQESLDVGYRLAVIRKQ